MFHAPQNKRYWSGGVGVYSANKGVIVMAKKSHFGVESGQLRVAECKTNVVLRWGTGR